MWRYMRRPARDTAAQHQEHAFYERGAPVELHSDNDSIFRGRQFTAFAARWDVSLRFRVAYAQPATVSYRGTIAQWR